MKPKRTEETGGWQWTKRALDEDLEYVICYGLRLEIIAKTADVRTTNQRFFQLTGFGRPGEKKRAISYHMQNYLGRHPKGAWALGCNTIQSFVRPFMFGRRIN